jgi:hypothetical protein
LTNIERQSLDALAGAGFSEFLKSKIELGVKFRKGDAYEHEHSKVCYSRERLYRDDQKGKEEPLNKVMW